MIKIKIQNI